ncbi:MAG: hypothetical protein RXO36_06735, partial [Candidatus Nanopusillus acidilobi]
MKSEETIIEDITQLENINKEDSTINIKTFRRYKIIEDLPAKGGESDNYIIEYEGKKAFLKLYRKGRTP